MEANGTIYATEKQNLATRLGVATGNVLADPNGIVGPDKTAVLREEVVLAGRFSYAVTKLDRGDLYPDALAVPGGDPELTGLAGVTPATATTPDTRTPITFHQAEQAAFNVEGIPRYDNIFIVMLENKSTQAILGSAYAPKINAYLHAGNRVASYYATGNPSEPNYTALGGADDFGIVDDNQWNCDATGANAPQDLPLPTNTQPGLAQLAVRGHLHQQQGQPQHRGQAEPVQRPHGGRHDLAHLQRVDEPGPGLPHRQRGGQRRDRAGQRLRARHARRQRGRRSARPAWCCRCRRSLYRTKHHPGMAYQNVRSAPEFKYSNRTLGGGQWDAALLSSTEYAIPAGYDIDQFGTDLNSGGVGQLNFVIPDQCDDMHGITVKGTVPPSTTQVTASDCSSVANNVPVATGGNIMARGDNYVDNLVKKIQASPLWTEPAEEGRDRADVRRGQRDDRPELLLRLEGRQDGRRRAAGPVAAARSRRTPRSSSTARATRATASSIFVVLNNQPTAPKGIKDTDAYSHFSFVRTLQDMFLLVRPDQGRLVHEPLEVHREVHRAEHPEPAGVRGQRRHALRLGAPDEPRVRHPGRLRAEADRRRDRRRHADGAGRSRRRRRPTSGPSSNVTVTHPEPAVAVNAASAGFFHGSDRDTQLAVWPDGPGRRRLRPLR